MKEYRDEFWYETNKDGTVSIGFTTDFIRKKMPECFHILQADTKNLKENDPMLVLETNDSLESIKSPVTGRVKWFNSNARNFPDQIKESDVILTVEPPGIKKEVPPSQFDLEFMQILNRPDNIWGQPR